MYNITINHKKGEKIRTYTVYQKQEADEEQVRYVYWKKAEIGDYALSDDGYVAKVLNKAEYPGNRGFHNIINRLAPSYKHRNCSCLF